MPQKKKNQATERIFADPTYDITFKMLFGNENHEKILISVINSLLNFQGGNQVKKVKLLSQEVPLEHSGHIKTILDVRCRTNNGEEILVEMQRQYKDYFLPRTQHYMARMLAYKMKSGESQEHHTKLPKTYILVLSREDLFIRAYKLDNDNLYEKTVVPMIKELNVEVPGNVMNWKYYEIQKFTKLCDENKIVPTSIKEQWLSFLDKCGSAKSIPNDVDEIIKEAYKIMEITNWEPQIKEIYEKALQKEQDEILEAQGRESDALAKGLAKGKFKGELKGEISKVKTLLKFGISQDKIEPELKFLNNDKVKNKLEDNMSYIKEHIQDSDSYICDELGLVADLSDFA